MTRLPPDIPLMAYLVFELSNENEIWEAEVYASHDGRTPSTDRYHLMLGDCPDKEMSIQNALEMIGWAVADQRRIDEPFIWNQGEGARRIIMSANPETEVVVNISTGGLRLNNVLQILQRGATRRNAADSDAEDSR